MNEPPASPPRVSDEKLERAIIEQCNYFASFRAGSIGGIQAKAGYDALLDLRDARARCAALEAALRDEIQKIDADERFHYPAANVVVNAPLALIQLEMETRVIFAQHLLQIVGHEGPEMEVEPGRRLAGARAAAGDAK